MSFVLDNRGVLITGASGGIGLALAKSFAEAGANLYLCGRNESSLKPLAEALGGKYAVCDLSDRASVSQLIPDLEQKFGPIDILINNGGVTKDQLAIRMKDPAWDEVLEVNLTAAFVLMRGAMKAMIKRRWGRIINISSVVAFSGNMGQGNYCAAKAGLVGLTKAMALEAARYNITVNAIAPGYIDTPMVQDIPEDIAKGLISKLPLQRMGTPQEIAYWATCLADPRSSYMTGQTLHINGGLWMG